VKNPTVQTSSTAVIQREGIKSEIRFYWMNQEPNEGGALSLRSVMGFLSDTWNSLNPKKLKMIPR
jgi:hypothetical protein